MKKAVFIVALLLAGLAPTLLSCGAPVKQKLFIYNWTYYIPDTVLKEFEKRYKVQVVYDVFSSNEEMFAKLKAGGTGYDITFPSGDYVSIMIHENMIEPIDKKLIPNFVNLDSSVLAKIKFDPGCGFSVPYLMGASGISVNTAKVPSFDSSWSIFNRADLKGRMTMLDDMREVMGEALAVCGYSVNTRDTAELRKAMEVVKGWKQNIMKFDAESFAKGFAAGEFWVVHGYAENVFLELDSVARQNVAFFIPREGGGMYVDNMVVLKGCKHRDLAYAFINFIHEPAMYAQIVDFLGLPSINVAARALVKKQPNYNIEDLQKCEFKEDLGPALGLYNKFWQELRAGG